MGLLSLLRKKRAKPRKKTVGTVPTDKKTDDMIKQWSKTIDVIENHPLSQARVINTGLLNDLTQILTSMNDKLDNLTKLDRIISLLDETKKQLEKAGLPTSNVEAAITSLKGLTVKDQDALKHFGPKDMLTTEAFASKAGLSRSTASSRLNKLFSFGLLDKVADGKQIVYKIKQ